MSNEKLMRVDMKIRTKCAFCDSNDMIKFMDFGNVALAGGFLKKSDFSSERKYNLSVNFCNDCFGVQVPEIIEPKIMFNDYFYFSSTIETLKKHFSLYAKKIQEKYLKDNFDSLIVEFGCNDGILLKPLADLGMSNLIGVDPATNVIATISDDRINIINNFFNQISSDYIKKNYGPAKLILANNVFAHIPDIQGTTLAIKSLLDDDGAFIFEVHYLGKVINEFQYDMIYHEHIYYYSLISLINHFKRYDLEIFDVDEVDIHAGSVRYHVCKKGSIYSNNINRKVHDMMLKELAMGLNKSDAFINFSSLMSSKKKKLYELLDSIKLKNKDTSIVGYGASGRANTLIQYCGLDHSYLDYMIDDAPAKKGFYTPGSHFLIKGSECLDEDPPDYLLILAWSFKDEIIKRCENYIKKGGKLIIPLPHPIVYSI